MNEHDLYMKIFEKKEELGSLLKEHWQLYSNMGTGYFWINLATFVVPLIVWFVSTGRECLKLLSSAFSCMFSGM